MRIVHYIREVVAEHGGVVKAVLDLCGALSARGHEVTLLTQNPQDVPTEWGHTPRTPSVCRTHFSRNPFGKPSLEGLAEVFDQAQVVHLHTPWEITNLPIARGLEQRKIPYIVSAHGMLDDWCMAHRGLKKRFFLAAMGRNFLENAFRIHCTAEGERQQSQKWMPRAQVAVLPLVLDLAPFESLPGPQPALAAFPALSSDLPKILFLGRLHAIKGLDILLRAVADAIQHGVEMELLLAGPDEENYASTLRKLAKQLNIQSKVHFLEMVRGLTKTSLFQVADLFVLPSHHENFGMALVEAMACGLPAIASTGVATWKEIEQAGGTVVPPEPASLSQAIRDRLTDPDNLRLRGKEGRDFVVSWLAPEKVIANYEAMYAAAL